MTSKGYFKKICKCLNSYEYTDEFKKGKKVIEKELQALKILKIVLGLNATNRAIIRQAYEAGWITEEEFNLLKEVLGKWINQL